MRPEKNREKNKSSPAIETLRWVARGWSLLSIGTVLAFFIGEGFHPSEVASAGEWIGLFFFPLCVCAGLVLGWRREKLGGTIAVGGLLSFYLLHLLTVGDFPRGWAFAAIVAPGPLFLLCGSLGARARSGPLDGICKQ